MENIKLTLLEHRILEFIRDYIGHWGYGPTLQEIGDHVDIRSRGTIHRYVESLKKKKCLRRRGGGWRDISLPRKQNRAMVRLPLHGEITSGQGIERIPGVNEINFSESLLGRGRFVLKVVGDNMIEAGILDGDLIIVRKTDRAVDGDIVVALIDHEEVTLKRMRVHGDRIELIPDNPTSTSMIYPTSRVHIQGVVVGQVRLY